MTLDKQLLNEAREARERVRSAERALSGATEEYRRRVRRLHVAGGALREIAEALDLSHQRVFQFVAGSPLRRRWKLRKRQKPGPLNCSFCNRSDREVQKLVAGPDVYICDGCINGRERFDCVDCQSCLCCSFCGKARERVSGMLAGTQKQVCNECLQLCEEIIA